MPRYFTLEEATGLLPQLTELLTALQTQKRSVDRLRDDLLAAARQAAGNGHLLEKDLAEKRKAVESAARQMDETLGQIRALGCHLKGVDEGLIDFPAQREGREVYLCWRLGEERIAYWHEVDTGFAGRQPLAPDSP